MAVEIKELVIRAEIDYASDSAGESSVDRQAAAEVDTEAIVRACVKQVLKALKQSRQR